ncbi:MAG: hypothetical protein LBP86_04485, partial [Azoarcus sp.]|nr:hypothetical protein [Azoarcus sp.]
MSSPPPPPHFRGIKSRLACLIGALGSALLPALPARADGENIAYEGDAPNGSLLKDKPSWWNSLYCGGRCLFPGEDADNPSASDNTVTVDYVPTGGITNPRYVLGGLVNGGISERNTVDFRNGRTDDEVYGGASYHGDSTSSTATNNTVNISGGTVGHNVYGGYADSPSASATDNTVIIRDNANIGNAYIIQGGFASGGGDAYTGNTLHIRNWTGSTNATISNFEIYRFTLSGNIDNDDPPVLTVNNLPTYGAGATLDIRTPGQYFLDQSSNTLAGDYVLLHKESGGQTLGDITTYSLYDHDFTSYALTLNTGRVRGDFTISIGNSDKDLILNVANYNAPNTTLTWTGTDGNNWTNYSTSTIKSPANWIG